MLLTPVNAGLIKAKLAQWTGLVNDDDQGNQDLEILLRLIWPKDYRMLMDASAETLQHQWSKYEESRNTKEITSCARKAVNIAEEELRQCMAEKQAQEAIEHELSLRAQDLQSNQAQALIGLLKGTRKNEAELDMSEVQALETEIKCVERDTEAFQKKCHQEDVRNRLVHQEAQQELLRLEEE